MLSKRAVKMRSLNEHEKKLAFIYTSYVLNVPRITEEKFIDDFSAALVPLLFQELTYQRKNHFGFGHLAGFSTKLKRAYFTFFSHGVTYIITFEEYGRFLRARLNGLIYTD